MALDPVCNMKVNEKTAKWTSVYEGTKIYFCAPGCKKAFDKDPEKYMKAPAKCTCGCSCDEK